MTKSEIARILGNAIGAFIMILFISGLYTLAQFMGEIK